MFWPLTGLCEGFTAATHAPYYIVFYALYGCRCFSTLPKKGTIFEMKY